MRQQRSLAALAAACALALSGAAHAAYGENGGESGGQNGSPVESKPATQKSQKEGGEHAAYGGKEGQHTSGNGTSPDYKGGSGYNARMSSGDGGNGSYAGSKGSYAANGGTTGGYTANGGASGSDSLLAHGTGVSHQALLAGGNEVSPTGKADAGDPDGNGGASISIDPEAGKVCFAMVVNNIDAPVAAHIHQAPAGKNGPVVVGLEAPKDGDPGSASGCVDNVDRALLQAIHAHPWAYYVNVHSSTYPEGAIRGQLF